MHKEGWTRSCPRVRIVGASLGDPFEPSPPPAPSPSSTREWRGRRPRISSERGKCVLPYLPAAPVGEIGDQEPPALLSAATATAARSAVRVAASAGPVIVSPSLGRLCELDEESAVSGDRQSRVSRPAEMELGVGDQNRRTGRP